MRDRLIDSMVSMNAQDMQFKQLGENMPLDDTDFNKANKWISRFFTFFMSYFLFVWILGAIFSLTILTAIIVGIVWLIRHM